MEEKMVRLRKGQIVTDCKTNRKGKYIRKDRRNLSIDLVVVQWEGDNFESRISPSLLKECSWESYLQSIGLKEVLWKE